VKYQLILYLSIIWKTFSYKLLLETESFLWMQRIRVHTVISLK